MKKAILDPTPTPTENIPLERAVPTPARMHADPYAWLAEQTPIKSSGDVHVPTRLLDQVIGQEQAVLVAERSAQQRRHLLLVGDPGTGKSMIAKAMAEMLPAGKLNDVLTYHNAKDPNQPRIVTVDAGEGPGVVGKLRVVARRRRIVERVLEGILILGTIGLGVFFFWLQQDVMALFFSALLVLFMFMLFRQRKDPVQFTVPKLLLRHEAVQERAPYVEATGSHAGALLGDVRHDPFQSGGLETPPHQRVEVGAIHRAHKGVLFIDEINVLRLESQQALLTALQDRQYAIVGQSQTSSGAMIRTDAVPCDFVLVAAGNQDAVQLAQAGGHSGMHPALRSRIRGYGYEVYVNSVMDDTHANRLKLVRFVAQEVAKDGRIPHFERDAIAEVLLEAQRRTGQRGKLTLRLRELGGLVRTAGDIAAGQAATLVTAEFVRAAKRLSRSLEQQIADAALQGRRNHESLRPAGEHVGVAHGAGLVGTGEVGEPASLVVPVAATVTAPLSRSGGNFAFGGGLDVTARDQTETVGALLKRLVGGSIADHDVHIQSLVSADEVDASAAGLALAVSALSSLHNCPTRQDTVLLGALSVAGDVRAVRGVTQGIEAAVDSGYTRVVVPEVNRSDVLLNPHYRGRVELVYVARLEEALEAILTGPRRAVILQTLRKGANGSNGAVVSAKVTRRRRGTP